MHPWLAKRTATFDSSGIRRVFDLAAGLADPINLSIGQPDFDVPEPVKEACIQAIRGGKNGYSQTQGIAPLREELKARIAETYDHPDRDLLITSGTSGALLLAMMAMVDPGDEVIFFDPYFVMYPALIQMVGGVPVGIDTYPDFRIDPERVAAAITERTKLILVNSPANPTGVTASAAEMRALADIAARHNLALVSDEIYREFCYDAALPSPADHNDQTIVIDGLSKSHAMTGWRVGWVHGPTEVVQTMAKLQQYTFVCAPQPVQWASVAALRYSVREHCEAYRKKRDRLIDGIADKYRCVTPGGAFYLFPEAPGGDGDAFVRRAIDNGLLIIPGHIFSNRNSHFRISYAADDRTLDRGIEVLRRLAE